MFDPEVKLAEARSRATEFMNLAIQSHDHYEREFHERLADLYTKIADELDRWQ